jgi:AcrR family transcriptional regulator
MSVQDVLDDLGSSRGAFYHYFDSKGALMEAAVERMTDLAIDSLRPAVEDPALPAVEKLQGLFSGLARWKGERADLMWELLRVWISDENALVREKFRRHATARLVPLLVPILEQGNQEGSISTGPVKPVAAVLLGLLLTANDTACHLFVARQENAIPFEEVARTLDAYARAFERILGLPPGSLPGLEPDILRFWFG